MTLCLFTLLRVCDFGEKVCFPRHAPPGLSSPPTLPAPYTGQAGGARVPAVRAACPCSSPTPLAGASLPDSFCSVCRSLTRPDGLESDSTERHWGLRLRARAFLASPWAKGSISVCLGSSAAGGPASESGTSFTAHASAHDPKANFFCCERAMGPRRVSISFESAGGKCCFLRGKAMCSGCDGRRRSK